MIDLWQRVKAEPMAQHAAYYGDIPELTKEEALQVLKWHQAWRTGGDDMVRPAAITAALDVAIEEMESNGWINIDDRMPEENQICELLYQQGKGVPSITISIYRVGTMASSGEQIKRFSGVTTRDGKPLNIQYWRPFMPPKGLEISGICVKGSAAESFKKIGVKVLGAFDD